MQENQEIYCRDERPSIRTTLTRFLSTRRQSTGVHYGSYGMDICFHQKYGNLCFGFFRFFCCVYSFYSSKPKSKNLKTNSPSRPERGPRPWRPPQLRMPRRLDSQTTESRKHTSNMPLMPVNAGSITTVEPVVHGAVPHRIGCCCTFKNRLLYEASIDAV